MNETYWHSVMLDKDNCKGCTTCLKHCPTQAIRIQNGKAKILKEHCIDCGECIRVCPYHAKKAITDSFDVLKKYKFNVALVPPSFCAQFSKTESIDMMLSGLKQIGFDMVFEVAQGAQRISEETRKLIKSGELLMPTISSACPAVVRLIAIRFPNLIQNIIPLRSPMEISAVQARKDALKKTGLKPEEIGIIFISPCAAKATEIRNATNSAYNCVDAVVSLKDTYLKMAQTINKIKETDIEKISNSGSSGVLWAVPGGEANASKVSKHISVDGIDNVIKIFEEIEDGMIDGIEYVEALACTGGCVGGPLAAENCFVAEARLKRVCEKLCEDGKTIDSDVDVYWDKPIVYRPVMNLDDDRQKAMQKLLKIEQIYEGLPKIDCGSCGSPTCRALAEDIVRGFAKETDCIFKLREKISNLVEQMTELDEN